MSFSYNDHRPRGLKAVLTAVAATGLVASGLVAPASAETGADGNCEFRDFSVAAQQTQGLPGQYQLAYSKSNDALWVTGSSGRPPIMTSTLAKVDPKTMKIQNTVSMDVVEHTPSGAEQPTGFNQAGAYGVGVDDVNNTVWTTNTRVNAVTAYDQTTMKKVFSTLDLPQEQQEALRIDRPREIQAAGGKVFVGVQGAVLVFDGSSHELLKRIEISDPNGRATSVMNFALDEQGQRGYFPIFGAEQMKVVDLQSLELLDGINLHRPNSDTDLIPSDVAFDQSLNELYVSSQGSEGQNAGVAVYDKTTGEFKKWIDLGTRGLSIDADEDKDLVYATDLDGTVKDKGVYIIDAKDDRISKTVAKNSASNGLGVNDVLSTPHGVFFVDKGGAYSDVEVPFTLNYQTGKFQTSNQEVKGVKNTAPEGQAPVWTPVDPTPIKADTLTKFTVQESGLVSGKKVTEEVEPSEVKTVAAGQDANATVTGATVLPQNQSIKVSGSGWKVADGSSGSVIAVKYDRNAVSVNGSTEIAYVDADAQGNWSVELPFPTTANSNIKEGDWAPGTEHKISFLSGSSKDGDVPRGANLKVTIAEGGKTTCEAPDAVSVTPTDVPFQGYGTFVNSEKGLPDPEPTPEPTEPTPGPTDEPTPAPTDEPTPAPTDEPTPAPTDEPTPAPTGEPTAEPTEQPTGEPSADPTAEPSGQPTAGPGAGDGSGSQPGAGGQGGAGGDQGSQGQVGQAGTTGQSSTGSGQQGFLANTGAGGVAWAAGIGVLVLAAGGALVALRRRSARS